MVQLENEVGMHGHSRDRSPAANRAFAAQVPKELTRPSPPAAQRGPRTAVSQALQEPAGSKASGTGKRSSVPAGGPGRELHGLGPCPLHGPGGRVGQGRYPIPMFTDAALYGINNGPQPASGGRPWDLVMDVWKAGFQKIDMLSPDSYSEHNFVAFCAEFDRPGNPVFVPENMGQAEGAG